MPSRLSSSGPESTGSVARDLTAAPIVVSERLAAKEVVGPFALTAAPLLAGNDDTAIGEGDLLVKPVRLRIPARPLEPGNDKPSARIRFVRHRLLLGSPRAGGRDSLPHYAKRIEDRITPQTAPREILPSHPHKVHQDALKCQRDSPQPLPLPTRVIRGPHGVLPRRLATTTRHAVASAKAGISWFPRISASPCRSLPAVAGVSFLSRTPPLDPRPPQSASIP